MQCINAQYTQLHYNGNKDNLMKSSIRVIACKYLGEWQEKGIFTFGNEHSGMSLHVCI